MHARLVAAVAATLVPCVTRLPDALTPISLMNCPLNVDTRTLAQVLFRRTGKMADRPPALVAPPGIS